jgi:2-polyprenyl-6-hydroxyphenyl methylase/3-demethylubiquinone-9 3-methyltransferase
MAQADVSANAPGNSDPGEVAKFARMAAQWWDETGEAAPLHRMNPCRLDYIAEQIAAQFGRDRRAAEPFAGLTILDAGCGGGLVAEPLARLGATVTGLDASEEGIAVARAHAAEAGLTIDYRVGTAEALAEQGMGFDVIVALEIVEHVPEPAAFVATLATLLRPGGILIMSTVNRTAASFMKAIVGAEFVLRWLPVGTHDWRRFLPPDTLAALMVQAGLTVVSRTGMVYTPLADRWRLDSRDLSVNYAMAAVRD